jgi:ActR/RegA family two-component response regulator
MARTTTAHDAGAGWGICPSRLGRFTHREVGSPSVASILIVEDEPLLGRQLARSLEAAGHDVRLAPTAAEALAAVREDPPDLALLDLRLPDRSGLDVLADLQGEARDVSVVLMTAYGSVPDAVEAMRRGAADYLQKPLELGLTVQRVLSRQREARELSWPGAIGSQESAPTVESRPIASRPARIPLVISRLSRVGPRSGPPPGKRAGAVPHAGTHESARERVARREAGQRLPSNAALQRAFAQHGLAAQL